MIRSTLMLAPLLLIAAGPAAPDPVKLLAGRYSDHFANGLMSGEQYDSDDVVEIVPVDPTHAYVRFELQFYNGHSCSLAGIARAEGDSLVYDDPSANSVGSGPCKLSISHRGADLAWNDHDGTCASFCGARGGFVHGSLAWKSKRPIRYMAKLKASSTYRGALTEWQKQ